MSKKFNVNDIVGERKNELDYSLLFQSKTGSDLQDATQLPNEQPDLHQNASIPESQNAGNIEIQHNTTATEKVTYRFHPKGKYAIEDIKTTLARKVGIKASYESIAEEAILIAYEDLLENQHASTTQRVGFILPSDRITVNGTGAFTIGGTIGDAGVVGRKIVVAAYSCF